MAAEGWFMRHSPLNAALGELASVLALYYKVDCIYDRARKYSISKYRG